MTARAWPFRRSKRRDKSTSSHQAVKRPSNLLLSYLIQCSITSLNSLKSTTCYKAIPNTSHTSKRKKKVVYTRRTKKNPLSTFHPIYTSSPTPTTQPTSQPPASISSKHAEAVLAHPSIYLLAKHPSQPANKQPHIHPRAVDQR
jgi:hypothetical protein